MLIIKIFNNDFFNVEAFLPIHLQKIKEKQKLTIRINNYEEKNQIPHA
mgnify:CR=1 FL=1